MRWRESGRTGVLALLLLPGCLPETPLRAGPVGTGPGPVQEEARMTAGGDGSGTGGDGPGVRSDELPRPRLEGPASDRLIYDQALGQNSNAALILYLARNPASPQAGEARARLAARTTPDAPGTALAVAGPDADVVSAFDAARLAQDAGALRAFLDRYAGHPLAAEAARLLAAR